MPEYPQEPFPDTTPNMGGGHRGGGSGGGGWGGGQESSPYKATTKWAGGDQNEPESSDTMTRGTTADQNEIKCSPLQSRGAVYNLSISIQDELPIQVRDPFHEHLEAHGKVSSVSEGTTRWASGHGKELESSEGTTRCASGRGKELESSEGTTRCASGRGKELESSEGTTRWASGRGKELESSEGTTRWASGKERVDSTSFDTQWSTDLTLPGQQLEMHLEDKYNGTETFPVLDLLAFEPLVTQQELMSSVYNFACSPPFFDDFYHGTHGDTKGAAHEMNEPFKLEPNCGASSSRSVPSILQQSLKETAGRTTDLGMADTESELSDIELEAHVQQDGNSKQCKDEAAGRQAQKLLSSIHQRLQGLKRAIGVIPTPPDYIVEDHCVQHDSESVITFGWRVASEANALELLFQSTKGMSSILGVGVEFAKVLVVPASLEVKIIGIGHTSWDALWQDSSNNKDDVIDIVSIAGVRRAGAKLENPSNVEYLTAKQRATKYGVGLENQSNTAHVNSTDVEPQSDCSCILDKVVEYLVLKKVIDAVMDKQCDGDGGEGSSSGANSTKQSIGGMSSSQSILSFLMSYLSLRQKPTDDSDDDDDDEISPSRKRPHQVNHKRPIGNFRRVTVLPGPGGSFDHASIPQELGIASIDPTLVFEFNYKLDMNGDICDKQIQITTTTSFDLGEAVPTQRMSDSFGWYQNPLTVSLRNCGVPQAKLYSPNCQLKETLKETKISAKTTHTHSKNSTSQHAAQVQGGYKSFIQAAVSANKTTSNGETIAKEATSENLGSDVWKGFQLRDLRVVRNSLLKYEFYRLRPEIRVLEDLEERHKCLGTGMCETVVPTFIGTWLITLEDVDEASSYLFDVERTLNRLIKVDQISEQEEFVQRYRVPMYVNHAMSHLCTLKDHPTLKEGQTLLNVLKVGTVGVV
ncbi:hypothetical protein CY35_13G097600 [Sphagnum magellanicum]|nr:hypothetical protein CY35_13G097600 [Sphagnum magellanicum]